MQSIAENLWICRKPFRVRAFGDIGNCATIIRYHTSKLLIISPVRFSDEEAQAIRALGEVEYLISPNPIHHLHLPHAHALFPQAKLAGPRASADKHKDLKFEIVLGPVDKFMWTEELETLRLPARPPLHEEFLFFHKPSATLVTTDLFFNLPRSPRLTERFFRRLNGLNNGLAVSKIGRKLFSDRRNLSALNAEILKRGPSRLIVGHGDPVLSEAASRIEAALSFARE